MPISPDQQTDPNKPRYGLPLDSCVGDSGGPTPEQARLISTSGAKTSAAPHLAPSGGSITAGGSRGKARAQQATEKWIPGTQGDGNPAPVGYDGP